ncbi:MAG: ATP synthase F0 subunit C [Candidatus Aminicenantes bacterium]|nr:ATP synthase F0 subunit C [Candidatus Aminicenantes bacterium]MDH5714227.1 ATP synthase F0 subunit C [Candidatus Aminicenantes bacterium]
MYRKPLIMLFLAGMLLLVVAPAFAQEKPLKETDPRVAIWAMILSAAVMGLVSCLCAWAQSSALSAACEGIARNPAAAGDIRGTLIIGLVLIESLALYSLVVIFIKI